MNRYIGAVDIGGTKIAVGLVRDDGSVLSRRVYPTKSFAGWRDGVRAIKSGLTECQVESEIHTDRVGIGCTGPVDPRTGVVGDVALLPGWSGCNLVEAIGDLNFSSVSLENDADAAALAEFSWGSGQGTGRFLYVTVSTGIGTGFICDGKLYRGANWSHPEMGHHSIDPNGPDCYCGSRGCWESLASGEAITKWYLHNADVEADETINAKTVFELAISGDEIARRSISRFNKCLGTGLANLTKLLVPDVIALGGGVMKSMSPYLKKTREVVQAASRDVSTGETLITFATLQDDVGLAGAAAVAINNRTWEPLASGPVC